jgi:hypothetical protein
MHLPFELQSLGHKARTDGAAVAAGAAGSLTAAGGLLTTASPLSHICVGTAVDLSVGSTVGLVVPDSNCNWLGDELRNGVGWMVVGISVSIGEALGVAVATDGASVVGTCVGAPVDGASEGRTVVGAALVGSTLGAGVVGSMLGAGVVGSDEGTSVEGKTVDGALVRAGDGSEEGPGDVGITEGGTEGDTVGGAVGSRVGPSVGERVRYEGAVEGSEDGELVGMKLGLGEGAEVGSWEGYSDGSSVTLRVGLPVGKSVGNAVLFCVGRADGRKVGTPVRPAASGVKEGAVVGLLDWTLAEITETRLTSAVEEVLAAVAPIAACAELAPLQFNVRRPLATSVAILSARVAADIPSPDRTRMSIETLAALTFMMWNRSGETA